MGMATWPHGVCRCGSDEACHNMSDSLTGWWLLMDTVRPVAIHRNELMVAVVPADRSEACKRPSRDT
jgi:hypothetical protein